MRRDSLIAGPGGPGNWQPGNPGNWQSGNTVNPVTEKGGRG
jgi:hypothetical protein